HRTGCLIPLLLLQPIAFNQKFDPAEHQFHEDGLRACPSAPHASVNGGEEHNAHHGNEHTEHEDVQILRPEHTSEQHELALDDVEEQERFPRNLDKRCDDEKCQQRIAHPLPAVEPLPSGFLCVHPRTFRLLFCHLFLLRFFTQSPRSYFTQSPQSIVFSVNTSCSPATAICSSYPLLLSPYLAAGSGISDVSWC